MNRVTEPAARAGGAPADGARPPRACEACDAEELGLAPIAELLNVPAEALRLAVDAVGCECLPEDAAECLQACPVTTALARAPRMVPERRRRLAELVLKLADYEAKRNAAFAEATAALGEAGPENAAWRDWVRAWPFASERFAAELLEWKR